jgi:transglutaminase-like putative cysteine protease
MKFGDQLLMRNMSSDETSTTVSLQPTPSKTRTEPGTTTYEFTKLPRRHDIPYVTVTWETTVNASGFVPEETPARSELTAATPFWPSNDPQVIALAEKITAGCGDDSAKVQAILEWLAPGRNLKYAGETGSRWGVQQVLKQGYGHCWDFSDCFISLARAAGVPCRQVGGWLYGSSGHVWAEYYQSGPGPGQTEPGWQQVDPTGGGKLTCGIYHIPYFTSETGAMPILYVALPTIEMVNEK